MQEMGKWLLVVGLVFSLVGGLLWLSGRFQLLGWFGHLPGDVHWKGEHVEVYVPWVSMLVVSLLLSLVLQVVSFLRR